MAQHGGTSVTGRDSCGGRGRQCGGWQGTHERVAVRCEEEITGVRKKGDEGDDAWEGAEHSTAQQGAHLARSMARGWGPVAAVRGPRAAPAQCTSTAGNAAPAPCGNGTGMPPPHIPTGHAGAPLGHHWVGFCSCAAHGITAPGKASATISRHHRCVKASRSQPGLHATRGRLEDGRVCMRVGGFVPLAIPLGVRFPRGRAHGRTVNKGLRPLSKPCSAAAWRHPPLLMAPPRIQRLRRPRGSHERPLVPEASPSRR